MAVCNLELCSIQMLPFVLCPVSRLPLQGCQKYVSIFLKHIFASLVLCIVQWYAIRIRIIICTCMCVSCVYHFEEHVFLACHKVLFEVPLLINKL